MDPQEIPEPIRAALEPGESVEAVFRMHGGLALYGTDRRLLSRRHDLVVGVPYGDITDVKRRSSLGLPRVAVGVGFIAAAVVTGFESSGAAVTALLLSLLGALFVLLGVFRRTAWVELGVRQEGSRPSLAHIAMFLPFWLLLRSGRRYKVLGRPEQVEALFEFLEGRLERRPA